MNNQNNNSNTARKNSQVTYKIDHHLGVLSTSETGWTCEVNLVSWNDRPMKLDIRDWNPNHTKMGRGVTLNGPEVAQLNTILSTFNVAESGI